MPRCFSCTQGSPKYRISCELTLLDDGEAAIRYIDSGERLEDGQPGSDLVLLDLNLPRFSGCEILRRLRASTRWRDVPVIILSSSDSPKDRAKERDLGATHYFCKPPDLAGFMSLGQLITSVIGDPEMLHAR